MTLLFSEVTASANGSQETFLVSGIPREYENLEGWTGFEDFVMDIDQDTEIQIHADAYLYGEGEILKASVEEVACFMERMRLDGSFFARSCDHIKTVDFSILWAPDELFGQSLTT